MPLSFWGVIISHNIISNWDPNGDFFMNIKKMKYKINHIFFCILGVPKLKGRSQSFGNFSHIFFFFSLRASLNLQSDKIKYEKEMCSQSCVLKVVSSKSCLQSRVLKVVSSKSCPQSRVLKAVSWMSCLQSCALKAVSSKSCPQNHVLKVLSSKSCPQSRDLKIVFSNSCPQSRVLNVPKLRDIVFQNEWEFLEKQMPCLR